MVPNRLQGMNNNIIPTELKTASEITSTDLTNPNNFYIGEDALHISSGAPYSIHWPIRRGRFNKVVYYELTLWYLFSTLYRNCVSLVRLI